ncbi:cyclic pyranopterin monophosphate synthase subunit MoaA [Jatrophihabitans sp. GAS493]|uniref:GTP 3',8-cyclase MoaA n=1 Tax=Jatrophihabitans sp. GAS493 TaxID=1907575 RepID=UPI000BB77E96|nr:GTP 3',8-cyclase MoaA [Jatrophihabitans sp. GAS493]SOD73977.1 cyclic pyranopterin monophosphate synthase subunit MoaA [Jatrophihabitans sp. GAS493]
MAADSVLIDRFGRVATDLRISLTDRCSLRCTYCMPAEGLDWLPRAELLTDDEIVTLAGVFVGCGVTSIRLTGGEPLLHRTLAEIVSRLAQFSPRPELSLTTNGVGLVDKAEGLVAAGLDRVNVSVDTLQPERFLALTRRNRLADVLAGVAAAAAAGLSPVKINAVLMRGSNFDEAPALLDWALRQGYRLRFIEHMPLDAQQAWNREVMVSAEEILELLGRSYSLLPIGHGPDGSAPAEDFEILDGPGRAHWAAAGHERPRVGIIASVTRPFCRDCDRLRLTSDGQLRTCLFARDETDLRGPLRAGASVAELTELITVAVAGKQSGHGIGSGSFQQPLRPMSAIGG